MTEVGGSNLFIDKSKKPKDDHGIIDIGKNCSKCHQLDYLPFTCEFCKKTYCSNHRTLDQHDCVGKAKFNNQHIATETYEPNLPLAQSLFPDRNAAKVKLDNEIKNSKPKLTNILQTQFRVGDFATPNAFSKFNKFLKIQHNKSAKSMSKIFGIKLFSSSSSSSSSTKNKIVELSLLKKLAKGDSKIQPSDRIYIWTLYIKATSDDDFGKINVENDRIPIFISKNWPVGRALDSIADLLKVGNYNNSTNDSTERLNVFKTIDDQPKLIETNERCSKAFTNNDIIYLVKGSIV